MNFAILGVLTGIMSAIASRFVPGISGAETTMIYVIVSIFTTTWHAAVSWRLEPVVPHRR